MGLAGGWGTPPPRYIGIIELAGKCPKRSWGTITCGQNLDLKELRSRSPGRRFQNGTKFGFRARLAHRQRQLSVPLGVQSQRQAAKIARAPLLPAFERKPALSLSKGGDFRERRLIPLLEFSDNPEASKFREKCRNRPKTGIATREQSECTGTHIAAEHRGRAALQRRVSRLSNQWALAPEALARGTDEGVRPYTRHPAHSG